MGVDHHDAVCGVHVPPPLIAPAQGRMCRALRAISVRTHADKCIHYKLNWGPQQQQPTAGDLYAAYF